MRKFILLQANLRLFDGDGGGSAAAPAAASTAVTEPAAAETKSKPGSSRRAKSGDAQSTVVYGKMPEQAIETAPADAAAPAAGKQAQINPEEDRKSKFHALIKGEYKDLFTQETQSIIDRRFRETKTLESQLSQYQPILETLSQRYGVADGDPTKIAAAIENDNAYWQTEAEQHGMSIDQFKQMRQLERQNASLLHAQQMAEQEQKTRSQVELWSQEAERLHGNDETPGEYPELDLMAELQNPQFVASLKLMTQNGFADPLKRTYESLHLDEIKSKIAQRTAQTAEKKVVSNIQARGARPAENSASSSTAITYKNDVRQLSKSDRAEIAKRIERGEKISF